MKLIELIGIKNKINMSIEEVFDNAIAKKYKYISHGAHGIVIENPIKPDQVIKFWFDDEGYDHYLKIANTIKSPHIIKIYKHGRFILRTSSGNKTVFYAKLEKLKPFLKSYEIQNGIGIVPFLMALDYYLDYDINDIPNALLTDIDLLHAYPDLKAFTDSTLNFIKVIKQLYDSSGSNDMDLKYENLMLRDNILVITDPYYNSVDNDNLIYTTISTIKRT